VREVDIRWCGLLAAVSMRFMPRPRAVLLILVVSLAVLTGCSKDKSGEALPAGATLLSDAATATAALKSAHVKIETEGEVSSLPMRRAEGDLLRSGDAKGTIQLSQFGVLIEYEFVVVGPTIYLKGATGGWQQLNASVAQSLYDPSAILDPNRGIAKLLSTARDPVTEAKESVNGKDAYRIRVKLDSSTVAALVPGITGEVTGKVWVDAQNKQLLKAVLTVPGSSADKSGTVTINVTNIDVPVTVSAP
jgi:lipoprotein LprG